MAITIVQSNSGANALASEPVAFLSNNGVGNLLVGLVNATALLPNSFGDSAGNSWQLLGSDSTVRMLAVYYCLSSKGGANTVTAGYSLPTRNVLSIIEVSAGGGFNWVVDGTYTAVNIGGPGTVVTGNPITLTHDNGIVISQVGVLALSVTITAGASWIKNQQVAEPTGDTVMMQTQIISASGNYTPTATISASSSWDVDISGFATVPSPGPPLTSAVFPLPVYKAIGIL